MVSFWQPKSGTSSKKSTYSFGAGLADYMWPPTEMKTRCLVTSSLKEGDTRQPATPYKVQRIIGKNHYDICILHKLFAWNN